MKSNICPVLQTYVKDCRSLYITNQLPQQQLQPWTIFPHPILGLYWAMSSWHVFKCHSMIRNLAMLPSSYIVTLSIWLPKAVVTSRSSDHSQRFICVSVEHTHILSLSLSKQHKITFCHDRTHIAMMSARMKTKWKFVTRCPRCPVIRQ